MLKPAPLWMKIWFRPSKYWSC